MASDPDPSVFTAMVSRLGGPSIAPEELDWAFDTLAGARIMDFFLSKVQSGNKSLGDVALEKEERDIILRASRAGLIDLETLKDPPTSASASRLSEYKRPSQLRLLTRGIGSQLTELQRETEKLRARVDKLQALSGRYDDSHTKAALKISVMKAEIKSEQSNMDKTLNKLKDTIDSIYKLLRDNLQTITAEVIGETYLTSLQAIGACLKSIYSALEEASTLWYDASTREAARVGALEEEANLVLDNFSELEDALVTQEFDSLLQRLDDGESLEDLLKSEEEDTGNVPPSRDAVKSVLDEAWRTDRIAWLGEEQQWLDEAIRILKEVLLPPAVLLHSLLVQMNARFANTRAQCGVFLDAINEVIPLELPEVKSETTPASGDPDREPSSASAASPST